MNHRGDHSKQRPSQQDEIVHVGRVYVFDPICRLYKPQEWTGSTVPSALPCSGRESAPSDAVTGSSSPGPTIPQGNDQELRHGSRWKARRKWLTFVIPNIISLATFGIVACYTYYAAEQVVASEGANDAARKANRDSGRTLGLTLEKMTAQIAATHDLSVAGGKQADASKAIADATGKQADQTRVLAENAAKQVSATQATAEAANSAAATGAATLVVQNRPWIKYSPQITVPLKFNVANGKGKQNAQVTVLNDAENVGQSVALNVYATGELKILGANFDFETALAWRDKFCDGSRNPMPWGTMIFPHDSRHLTVATSGPSMDEVQEAAAKSGGKVSFLYVGCVSYKASFEGNQVPNHQTRFMYALEDGNGDSQVDPHGIAPQLRLVPFFFGNSAD